MTDAARDHGDTQTPLRPVSTFFGARVADIEDLRPGNVAAIGVYCDHYSAGRPGGRFAARQLRYASTISDMSVPQSVVDLGDFNVFPLEPERTLEFLSEQSRRIIATGAKLFALGGDYSISSAIINGIAREIGETSLAVIRISRRFDLLPKALNQTDAPWRYSATNELSENLSGGLSAVALLGGRGTVAVEERERASTAIVVPASRLVSVPGKAVHKARNELERVADRFYLSVDTDVLAPRFGASALKSKHGGLSLAQLLAVLAALDGMPFVGAELTGHVPDLDVPGRAMTSQIARLAAKILECMAGKA
jgi:arginase family enzyme